MDQKTFLTRFQSILNEMFILVKKKNSDYASPYDAFLTFRSVEELDITSVEIGLLTRMTDKLTRIGQLIKRDAENEPLEDSLIDLAVYCLILMVWLGQKNERTEGDYDGVHEVKVVVPATSDPTPAFEWPPQGEWTKMVDDLKVYGSGVGIQPRPPINAAIQRDTFIVKEEEEDPPFPQSGF